MIRSPGEVGVFEVGDEVFDWSAQWRMRAVITRDLQHGTAFCRPPLFRLCQMSRVIDRHVRWNAVSDDSHDVISVGTGFDDGAKFDDFSHFDFVLRMSKAY
jgi:hypothetical protein